MRRYGSRDSTTARGTLFFPDFTTLKPDFAYIVTVYTNFLVGYNRLMTAEYVVGLLGVLGSLFGVAAFVWAFRHRQLKTQDQEMYESLVDDEPDYGSASTPVRASYAMSRLFAVILISILGLIGWMIWQTVRVVMYSPTVPAASSKPLSQK